MSYLSSCKNRKGYLFGCIAFLAFAGTSCQSSFTDISPDGKAPTTGGLTLAVAGTDASLFAVSLNAGLWHSVISRDGVREWTQAAGPRYPQCVAVDRADPMHVVVGDRDGDAAQPKLNECGIWESVDGGVTFTYAWNPMEMPGTFAGTFSTSQIVEAVAFSSASSIIAATTVGIARRAKGAADFLPSVVPTGTQVISNLVASETKIWARTLDGVLLVSTDDGKTFTNATAQPLPAGVVLNDVNGDAYSLAASDKKVIMSGCCAVSGPAPVNGHPANEMIIYDVDKDSWRIESFLDGAKNTSTEGTYLGGRRFVRSCMTNTGVRFFFSNAQHVWEVDLAGTHTLLGTSGVDNPGTPLYPGNIHNDFWDFGLDKNGTVMWVACDGGVFENRSDGKGWTPAVSGYHTQAVQSLDIFYDPDQTQVAYGTQDNAAWWGRSPAWKESRVANWGDVNFSDADPGSETYEFFCVSRPTFMLASVDGTSASYSSDVPMPRGILADPYQPDTPGIIQFIKGYKNEAGTPLDALLIVHRPVMNNTKPATPINPPPALAGIEQTGNSWLLRNRKFAAQPDFYKAVALGNWTKELDDLPAGTYRVLASGGHADPHYYAIVQQGPGLSALWERKLVTKLARPKMQWVKVFDGIIPLTEPCFPWEGWYGPVFVNPYDPSKIYLLAPDGVKVSHRDQEGNLQFTNDDVLTMLITASHSYPLVRQFCSGNPANVLEAKRMLGETTLGTVSFFRDAPERTLVSSPFTGVFYDDGGGHWRSFSNLLPRGPVWAAKMDQDNAYIGFAGRSVGKIEGIQNGALGSYFTKLQTAHAGLGGGQSIPAKLNFTDGTAGVHAIVSTRITGPNGKTLSYIPSLQLDDQGRVVIPFYPIPAGSVVHIHFTGSESSGLASSEYHLAY